MAMVEAKLVTGFVPEQKSFNLLRSGFYPELTRAEYRGKTVAMYFNQVSICPTLPTLSSMQCML